MGPWPLCRFGAFRHNAPSKPKLVRGAEAVEMFHREQERFDLALLDVVMPNMDGITAARRLRAVKADLKVIFLSAHDSGKGLHELLRRDCERLVSQPVSIEQLSRTIRRELDAAQDAVEGHPPRLLFRVAIWPVPAATKGVG